MHTRRLRPVLASVVAASFLLLGAERPPAGGQATPAWLGAWLDGGSRPAPCEAAAAIEALLAHDVVMVPDASGRAPTRALLQRILPALALHAEVHEIGLGVAVEAFPASWQRLIHDWQFERARVPLSTAQLVAAGWPGPTKSYVELVEAIRDGHLDLVPAGGRGPYDIPEAATPDARRTPIVASLGRGMDRQAWAWRMDMFSAYQVERWVRAPSASPRRACLCLFTEDRLDPTSNPGSGVVAGLRAEGLALCWLVLGERRDRDPRWMRLETATGEVVLLAPSVPDAHAASGTR